MKKKVLSILSLSTVLWVNAQEKDSLNQKKIEEVVITGQYMQQSINKSIYKVEVIDAEQIRNMAVTNVAEVLNQNLNILIEPNKGSGDSNANIMGLSGEYTKILIDNIPVVSDQGMGNLVDLTKINVNNIERIEVVKGAMGVEYGNNALAGVINIITKKNYGKKFTAIASVQEETVNKDYDWFKKGNGRHIQSLNLGYRINDNWSVSADINHNDFQGYKGRFQGYKYFSENNDGQRGYDWQPKDQLTTNGTIRYNKNNTSFFYKVNYLTEKVNYYNPLVEEMYLGNGNRTYIANDKDYRTKRWIHQFNIQTKIGSRINYNGDFSYQSQERKYQDYQYNVPNRQELSRAEEQPYYKSEVLYSRGMFSNFLDSEKVNFQIGYELDRTKGFASSKTGLFGTANLERTIFNYAHFISAEWNVNSWFSLRPGLRLALSDKFDSQYNYSATARFKTTKNSDIRLVFGSANRFPTYDELYTYMVDNNHDIRGNENLKPETGYSASIFWDYNKMTANDWKFNFSVSGMFLDVQDRIESVIVSNSPLRYTYINIDNYKSMLFGGGVNVRKGNLSLNAGVSVMGISQVLNTGNIYSPDDFNFYAEANLAANYTLPYTKTLFALYYKYTGKQRRYTHRSNTQDPMDPGEYVLGEIGDFNMLNFTLTQPFFNNHLDLSVGIKNIFNVTTVPNTTLAGGGHNAADTQQNLFYGRSYFARLTYNF
ncbi:TonB-dependent receptor [Chryseobacterium piperi]|uniref:TonB-dependent receptor n=1 Tax=Chryseobacterium piperi TaxID=558152 RepID=A0A086BMM4_9FLAO|nr:TonB-dependent receptor [Chryseobacterium piperi]ASW74162.1 TonB-dependent receptor [Chryseobacterium piperi]KFF30188.1 TonB-dependent receptor [Chryseobacterium piperi]